MTLTPKDGTIGRLDPLREDQIQSKLPERLREEIARLTLFAAEADKTSQSFTEAYIAAYGPGGRMVFAQDLSRVLDLVQRLEVSAVPGEPGLGRSHD